ncbi:ATP-dependent DNA helicase DinG [Peribacillus frigoritolerans]|uniref:ATP-dependent DNA helicase DinG n=1 Tax=Peribacillus frigoritolerans TaxID=450367 RepID=UPI002E1FE47B|nr:ATP-dependent DNA helicase DinG [Peribacillus frigoritolerans]MED4695597.1 ATP-dependent DNA helicase DinG [Peribacillus frigoritolerans]
MMQRYVVVDLETTGNSPKKGDRIIQFAGVVIENDQIVDEYSTFIHPGQEISLFIEELTGISNETVKNAPDFEDVAENIARLIEGACFVAHNVLFDLSFLQEELVRCGYEPFYGSTLDTVELAKILKPTSDGYKLHQLAKEENLDHSRPHQADSDAYATALLLLELKKKLMNLPVMTLKQLYRLSYSLQSEVSELIDACIASKLAKAEVHSPDLITYRGLAFKKAEHEGDHKDTGSKFPLDNEEKVAMLQSAFPAFEARSGQLDMMNLIHNSFETSQDAIIEAGTGIGKSIGYLLPAVYFAKKHQKPVVVSTYTLQLQDQLLQNEVPKLKKILPFTFQAVLLKGRSNYLSLAKFERALREKEDNYETALTKMQILVWLTETVTGDKDELNLTSGGQLFWNRLQSDGLTYAGLKQPWLALDFFERAKKTAAKADIIITNHSFLMTDLLTEDALIPKKGYLVLDEAHHLEQAASKQLGSRLNYISVKTILNRLGTSDQKQLLYKLDRMLLNNGLTDGRSSHELDQKLSDFSYEFEQLFYYLSNQAEKLSRSVSPKRLSFKIDDGRWGKAILVAERLVDLLGYIITELEKRLALLLNNESPLGKNSLFHLNDIEVLLGHLQDTRDSLHEFFIKPHEENIYWLDYTNAAPQHGVTLTVQPIAGSKRLWDSYFGRQKSVVMTSATLVVKDSFKYFKEQLGLENEPMQTASFPSPFPYKKLVKVLVPNDLPDINCLSVEEFSETAANHIIAAAQAAKGRMMVLFTSHEMLRATYHSVKDCGVLDEFTLFAQGISGGSRMRLLRNFQNFEKAVLFGTTSLWEGVDIPGEDLSCLIIVRLPFSPPDEPVTAAKCQLLEKQGRNPFSEYSLPEALLRFRQGFGRLIRTPEDKGILVILDRRIITAKYGTEFQKAIPKVDWHQGTISEMAEMIEEWI